MKQQAVHSGGATPSGRALGPWQIALRAVPLALILGTVLLGGAGTIDWPAAWVYIGITLVLTLGSRVALAHYSPDLVQERAESARKAGTKQWDRVLMPVVAVYGPLVTLLVAALDRRWGGPPQVPAGLEIIAAVALLLANLLGFWAMLSNRFFSGVVRIQAERGHTVVTRGPYRFVRHPGYVSGFLGDLAIPLMLGSIWALIPGILTAGAVILRTGLEDRTLQAELPGYAEYAGRTRYRLFPGIW